MTPPPEDASEDRALPNLGEERVRRLLETGRSLVSGFDTDSILATVLETARDLTGARYAAFGMLEGVQLVRGSLTVDSGRGSRTTIRIELPSPRQPEAQMPPAA
jgi:hypothetical protein